MKNIAISVIMPCLNAARYISETIDSVLAQTLDDFEFIIVDSGSTDGTIDIINHYVSKDTRIRLLVTNVKSMGHQYNRGIENAQGAYICFVESDDYYEVDALENLYTAITQYKCDFVRANFSFFADVDGRRCFIAHQIFDKDHSHYYEKPFVLTHYPSIVFRDVNMWNGIYDRQFIKKNNIRLNETSGAAFQDSGFVLQTNIFSKSAFYINKSVYNYRQDNYNSSFFNKAIYKFIINEYLFIRKFFHLVPDIVKVYIVRRFFSMFDYYVQWGVFNQNIPIERRFAINEFSEFKRQIKEDYDTIALTAHSFSWVYPSRRLSVFFKNPKRYLIKSLRNQKIYVNHYLALVSFLKSHERLVICGAGERGKHLYVFLRLCGIKHIDLFDNDKNKQGTEIFGKTIKNIDTLKATGSFFLVSPANKNIAFALRNQLIEAGIDANAILWFYLYIDGFHAFQLPIRFKLSGG